VTGPTIRYQVRFRGRTGSALVAPRARETAPVGKRAPDASAEPSAASGSPCAAGTATARLLALAHAIDRQVRAGTLRDYREAARRLGVSHARVSQITGLLLLAPGIQADLVAGQAAWSEVLLRAASQCVDWVEQRGGLRNHAKHR